MNIRSKMAVALVAAVSIISPVVATTTAYASPVAVSAPLISGQQVCSDTGAGLCIQGAAGDGDGVLNNNSQPSSDIQRWKVVFATSSCNSGDVSYPGDQYGGTTWCPFTNHSYDTQYDGYAITHFTEQYDSNYCIGAKTFGPPIADTLPTVVNCGGGTGVNFVQTGTYTYTNVYLSNTAGIPGKYDLCSDGFSGDNMVFETYQAVYCQLAWVG